MGTQQSRQLLEAASTGNVQQLSLLLKSVPVDIRDDDGWTALHFSSWAGRADVVEELLKHGADVRVREKVGFTDVRWCSADTAASLFSGPRFAPRLSLTACMRC